MTQNLRDDIKGRDRGQGALLESAAQGSGVGGQAGIVKYWEIGMASHFGPVWIVVQGISDQRSGQVDA